MHANHSARARQQHRVSKCARTSDSYAFFNLLTSEQLLNKVESLLPEHRERVFPPTETLSMFLAQALSADRSCQKAVDEAAVKRLAAGLPRCSTHTGAYCRARLRLPTEMVQTLTGYVGQWVAGRAPEVWCWRGRPVRKLPRQVDTFKVECWPAVLVDDRSLVAVVPAHRVVGVRCSGACQ